MARSAKGMQHVFVDRALLSDGWGRNVRIGISGTTIACVERDCQSESTDCNLGQQVLLPAPANLHSHTFQRAIAGLTESRGSNPHDSFWTWRELMYRYAERLTPDDIEAIAALAFVEMLEAGFGAVCEFHYLHHMVDGTPYDDIAECAARIISAANQTGIGLTLLPVLYCRGGTDDRALTRGQLRFKNDIDQFHKLVERCGCAMQHGHADGVLGMAPHSLRAVGSDHMHQALQSAPPGPIHMHIAEQIDEVEDISTTHGKRPVHWLLDNFALDKRWCLIHATHITPAEINRLAKTDATVGLCPITEASLGDGIFPAGKFCDAGGRFGIGSDSNIRICLAEELRLLEYGQRLRDRQRAVLATQQHATGRRLFDMAVRGGAAASARKTGKIAVGYTADLVSLDLSHLPAAGLTPDTLLDAWIFTAGNEVVREVWSAGRHQVHDGRHVAGERIRATYQACITNLRG